MKAAVYYEPGGPEVLRYEDIPDPVAAPDGVIIEVEAISIEGADIQAHRYIRDVPSRRPTSSATSARAPSARWAAPSPTARSASE